MPIRDGTRRLRMAGSDAPPCGLPSCLHGHSAPTVFTEVASTVGAMHIHEVVTALRSPWQNAYIERLIGSIRRECLDHVIVLRAAGLRRVLADYVAYYMHTRTHLSLDKDAPASRPIAPLSAGRIVEIP